MSKDRARRVLKGDKLGRGFGAEAALEGELGDRGKCVAVCVLGNRRPSSDAQFLNFAAGFREEGRKCLNGVELEERS